MAREDRRTWVVENREEGGRYESGEKERLALVLVLQPFISTSLFFPAPGRPPHSLGARTTWSRNAT